MRFGTYYFLQAPPAAAHPDVIRHEIEQMMWTEELGFDSIWLTEHHFIDYGLSVSPSVLAAAAAMRTRRVRIGLAAAILPFHDPVRLAEELAIVDILSEGRLDVGVGRDEFRRLGVGEMLCWMNFGGLPQERVRRSMELFAREVMPRCR